MPAYNNNTCQSAGPHGIGKYDCSCPLVVPGGVQCRTMLSQRPCGARDCTREECSRARVSASVLATIPDTENDVTGSESAPQTTGEGEPPHALTSLTRDELWSVWRAVRDRLPQCRDERALWSAWSKLNDALEL